MNFKLGDLIDYRTYFDSNYSKGGATIVSKNLIQLADGDMQAYVGLGIKIGDTWEVYNSFNIDRENLRKLKNATSAKFITINAPTYDSGNGLKYGLPEELTPSDISYVLSRNDGNSYKEATFSDTNDSCSILELKAFLRKLSNYSDFLNIDSFGAATIKSGNYELKLKVKDKAGEIIYSPASFFKI